MCRDITFAKFTNSYNWPFPIVISAKRVTQDLQTKPYYVLIIDDEPDIHAVVKMCVKNEKVNGAPIEVLTANSKQSALSLIHQFEQEIALIFLDVIMETDNAGFEFLAELRTSDIYPQPQVILLTGQAGLGSERDVSKQHEINAYLSKTDMNPYRIVSLLNTCIRNFETIKQLDKKG